MIRLKREVERLEYDNIVSVRLALLFKYRQYKCTYVINERRYFYLKVTSPFSFSRYKLFGVHLFYTYDRHINDADQGFWVDSKGMRVDHKFLLAIHKPYHIEITT